MNAFNNETDYTIIQSNNDCKKTSTTKNYYKK